MEPTHPLAWLLLLAVATSGDPVPVVGGPCEGCEAVFQGLPTTLAAEARIAPPGEPGEPLRIEGTVRDADGRAVPGVIVYAYHTDARGLYPRPAAPVGPAADRHGRLRAFARSASDGAYAFDTIRPAAYPGGAVPQHVHLHVVEPGRCTYWIDDLVFDDDPLLGPTQRAEILRGRGGRGLATPRREGDGWIARRDIVLGAGIDDYGRCGSTGRSGRPGA
jgi:protocatechuate 3,4-dioxygenase beta subunit